MYILIKKRREDNILYTKSRRIKYLGIAFIEIALIFIYSSCNNKKDASTTPLFSLVDSSGINFQNTVIDNKLENSFYFRNFYNGGGVAIGDINNDGLCDVLLTSNMNENILYLNKGDFRFEDITANSKMKQDNVEYRCYHGRHKQ